MRTVFPEGRTMAFILVLCSVLSLSGQGGETGPTPPHEASRRFRCPPGFQATLFAGEPYIVQPIAFTFDDRGRIWMVENHSYPGWKGEANDRVLILDDTDGDGRFDQKSVFLDNGKNLSGIEWGFGGVWLCSTPELVFVPDANRDDRPDGPPLVKLDGWDPTARHNVFSNLTWGPDGWLYGCNGILSQSRVGRPGSADKDRTEIDCGVWRYHPMGEQFEVFARGTTNPWGLDFDAYGQLFATNCVIQHLWHVIPGARFQRMFGEDANLHSYQLMSSCADHIHWAGGNWRDARGEPRHDSHGGGHAHVGAMVYLGDNWPAEYRQSLLTCNLHGNRLNRDLLVRRGSSYVARHAPDFLHAGDPWFRGMTVKYGPDGSVFVSDWCDTGECHNYEIADRTNGRIFKISYGRPKPWSTDLQQCTNSELVAQVNHANEWISRHARRVLQERHADRPPEPTLVQELRNACRTTLDPVESLRWLWTLNAIGSTPEEVLVEQFDSPHDVVRGWGVRLAAERSSFSPILQSRLRKLAKSDPSPWVRMAIASALQRIPLEARWDLLADVAQHDEDENDTELMLMLWYAAEPLVMLDTPRILATLESTRLRLVQEFVARRIAAADPSLLALLVSSMQRSDDAYRESILRGIVTALEGKRHVPIPDAWNQMHPELSRSDNSTVRDLSLRLSVMFGDPQAVTELRTVAADTHVPSATRGRAIDSLVQGEVVGLADLLLEMLSDQSIRPAALRGLAKIFDERTPDAILERYPQFRTEERDVALHTLTSRLPFARSLVLAIDQEIVPISEVTAYHVQQLDQLGDAEIGQWLRSRWGAMRSTPEERLASIRRYKSYLTEDILRSADASHGRVLFSRHCAGCHRLFEEGQRIGPELTGAQRNNLDYLLTNILDPSAVVPREFRSTSIETVDGRIMTGLVVRETPQALIVQTPTERIAIPADEVADRRESDLSMMPDGILASLQDTEVRDLVAYLSSESQVPLK